MSNQYLQLQKNILKHFKKENIFFVQVGSYDGVDLDPIHKLIVDNRNWKGLFVEPVTEYFEKLKQNYKESKNYIFEQQVVSSQEKEADFYWVSSKAETELALPKWYKQLSSLNRKHITKHLYGSLEPYIVHKKVKTTTLQNLLTKHNITKIDLLHIDTEGHDYEVLKSIDLEIYKPSVILYEYVHLTEEVQQTAKRLLQKYNYDYQEWDSGDVLAIKL